MINKKWDEYFYSHYHPEQEEWGVSDFIKYKRWYTSWITFIKKKFSLSFKTTTALELGCAIGSVTSLLKEENCDVTGSDIADVMVEHAKKLSPDIPFIVYDIMEPFPEKQTYDYIIAFEVLEHINNLHSAGKNISTLLKKNGFFIGTTPYPYTKNMVDPTHINVHLPFFWKTFFHDHGFTTIHTIPISCPPLLWKIPPYINPIINSYISMPGFVSTTLIIAQK